MEIPNLSGQPAPTLLSSQYTCATLNSGRGSCASICGHYLWSFHSLPNAFMRLSPWAFSILNNSSNSLHLFSHVRDTPVIILVAFHWTLSSSSLSLSFTVKPRRGPSNPGMSYTSAEITHLNWNPCLVLPKILILLQTVKKLNLPSSEPISLINILLDASSNLPFLLSADFTLDPIAQFSCLSSTRLFL